MVTLTSSPGSGTKTQGPPSEQGCGRVSPRWHAMDNNMPPTIGASFLTHFPSLVQDFNFKKGPDKMHPSEKCMVVSMSGYRTWSELGHLSHKVTSRISIAPYINRAFSAMAALLEQQGGENVL